MIRLDEKGMRPLAAASLVAALIIAIAGQRTHDPCARPEALYETAAIPRSGPGVESEIKPRAVFQRTEGEILGTRLHYVIVRGYRTDRLTRAPVSYSGSYMAGDRVALEWTDVDGTRLPLHFVTHDRGSRVQVAAYLYVFDGRPVEGVLRHRLATAGSQLVHGRQPLTLLLVWGVVQPPEVARQREIAERWLAGAWRFYDRTCAP